jgi:DNA polymerase-4
MMPHERVVAHVDLDAFFASVEQVSNPELAGRPVVVAGGGARGAVAAASYEARTFKVRAAMPTKEARRLCPDVVVVEPRLELYRAVSRQVFSIVGRGGSVLEPMGMDEVYLDVSSLEHPVSWAQETRSLVRDRTGLTATIGLGHSKLVAKLASQAAKPDGLLFVDDDEAAFLSGTAIGDLPGVGPVTKAHLSSVGVKTVGDLLLLEPGVLVETVGERVAEQLERWAAGQDDRDIMPAGPAQSFGRETTFVQDLVALTDWKRAAKPLVSDVAHRLAEADRAARTVTVKARYSNWQTVSRSASPTRPVSGPGAIEAVVETLIERLPRNGGIRLLGVSVSGLEPLLQEDLFMAAARREGLVFGDLVEHPVFGPGAVLWFDPVENVVAVRFDNGKVRELDHGLAGLGQRQGGAEGDRRR